MELTIGRHFLIGEKRSTVVISVCNGNFRALHLHHAGLRHTSNAMAWVC